MPMGKEKKGGVQVTARQIGLEMNIHHARGIKERDETFASRPSLAQFAKEFF